LLFIFTHTFSFLYFRLYLTGFVSNNIYSGLAEVYKDLDSLELAEKYLNKGYINANELNDTVAIGSNLVILATIRNKKGDHKSALSIGTNALRIYQKLKLPDCVSYSYASLSEYYEDAGDYKMALSMGDTVNIASRMESAGEAGKVNISSSTYELVKNKFICNYRGKVEAKNKGLIDMYFVEGVL
jgi:hypothetical protein